MRNPIPNLRQSTIISEQLGYLSEKLKTMAGFNYHRAQFFLLKCCTRFLFINVYKRVLGIFCYLVQILRY